MIDQAMPPPTLSGPPVSRWWGCFPDLRRDTLGFLLQSQAYGDVVKLPMGLVVELLLQQRAAAMYVLNHPADVKHVLVTNQDNYTKAPVPRSNRASLVGACFTRKAKSITVSDGYSYPSFMEIM